MRDEPKASYIVSGFCCRACGLMVAGGFEGTVGLFMISYGICHRL